MHVKTLLVRLSCYVDPEVYREYGWRCISQLIFRRTLYSKQILQSLMLIVSQRLSEPASTLAFEAQGPNSFAPPVLSEYLCQDSSGADRGLSVIVVVASQTLVKDPPKTCWICWVASPKHAGHPVHLKMMLYRWAAECAAAMGVATPLDQRLVGALVVSDTAHALTPPSFGKMQVVHASTSAGCLSSVSRRKV